MLWEYSDGVWYIIFAMFKHLCVLKTMIQLCLLSLYSNQPLRGALAPLDP